MQQCSGVGVVCAEKGRSEVSCIRGSQKPNLVGMPRSELAAAMAPFDGRPFRTEQVYHWLNRRLAAGFADMRNVPKALREALEASFQVTDPKIVEVLHDPDGTAKLALAYGDGAVVEAVLMAMEGHTTICLSVQTGCAVGCVFCVTGALGAGRNLSAGEIHGQYRAIVRHAGLVGAPLNVVFMGMGEPLLNLPGLLAALDLMSETVSPKRVTVSTSGIVPGLDALALLERRPNLAVSLNATTQAQRQRLMPLAARWSLDDLMAALRRYPLERGRRITIEYVLIAGQNDTLEDAARLAKLVHGLPCKVNLIPLNPDLERLPGLSPPDDAQIDAFAAILAAARLNVTVRWSKGQGIAAACGQLKGRLLEAPPRGPA
jgi:23S rRNA (adenine2503-C2)-methyltransferase